MAGMTTHRRGANWLVFLALLGMLFGILPAVTNAPPAQAATASDWDPGFIISDANFYDSSSMTAADIQAFLNGKVPTCRATAVPCLKNYSQTTDNRLIDRYCNGYTARQNETAAQIIDNVARSCGISQKVLLVLLEKEQSLVTSSRPDEWSYTAATGQGCPDTAPCDPRTSGFFYQVYYAARQYEIYRLTPKDWGYQAGRWNNILYSPDASCGTRSVYIQNQATAGLYIYTPYTPNQAALNNLYGRGDGCSTYGNRNFWRLFSDWFGSPTGYRVVGEYADAWSALGRDAGILGSPTADETCVDGRYCMQLFRGGTIFWFPGRGVFAVPSVIEGIWRNLGFIDGAAGFPTGVMVCSGTGTCTQSFDGGVIAADGGGGHLVGRHVEQSWAPAGGISLGGARGPELCSDDGRCAQMFARGALFAGGTATAVTGAIFDTWTASGLTTGTLGFPLRNAACGPSGCTQEFVGGLIVSAGGRTESVPRAIATKFLELGGLAVVGTPQTAAACTEDGACNQRFTAVRIDTSQRGTIATRSWFLQAWGAAGYEQGRLGLPLSEMVCVPATCYQSFVGGVLSGSPSAGVVPVFGAYRDVWMAAGGPEGSLGLPLGPEKCARASCSMEFQGGVITWSQRTGAFAITEPILGRWVAGGGAAGTYGLPTSGALATGTSTVQAFEHGSISVEG